MSQTQKLLLAFSAVLLVGAQVVKRWTLSDEATILVGLVEILIAVGIGLAFGFTKRRDEKRP